MVMAAHFLSKAGLLLRSQAGVCAGVHGELSYWLFWRDRVEQETESELSHWFESGGELEC
jgi:hypothetical protein